MFFFIPHQSWAPIKTFASMKAKNLGMMASIRVLKNWEPNGSYSYESWQVELTTNSKFIYALSPFSLSLASPVAKVDVDCLNIGCCTCAALLHSEPCCPLSFIKRTCSVFGLQERATSDGCINSLVLLQALLSNYNPGLQLSPAAKQIELDLLRTLPNNKHYESPHSSGYYSLYRERELDLLRTLPNNKH